MNLRIVNIVTVASVLLAITAHAEPSSRIQELDKGEVFVELVEDPKSGRKEGLVEGVIDAPPEQVWPVITDYDHYEEFMPRGKESEIRTQLGFGVRYYSKINMPWPIRDIAYVADVYLADDRRSLAFKMVPGTGIGMKSFHGGWSIEPFRGNANRTLGRYLLIFEQTTRYPRWVERLGARSTLNKIIGAIRKRVKEQNAKSGA